MRILANENVPGDAVELLRHRGHDVRWARTDMPAAPDEHVLRVAVAEARLLITFDKDFGELVVRLGLDAPSGVVLFRIALPSAAQVAQQMAGILESRGDWSGKFSVVEANRVRMLPLPVF